MKRVPEDVKKARQVLAVQEDYCRMMRAIAIDAHLRAEAARRYLLNSLRDIMGEDQPDPGNPYPQVKD